MRFGEVTGQERDVAELMDEEEDKWWYPLELVRAAPDNRLGKTSIYVVVTRMVARGLLDVKEEERPKRAFYRLSEYGRRVYKATLAAEREREKHMRGMFKPKNALG